MKITRKSIITGTIRTMDLPITQERLDEWQKGGLIQDVFPELTSAQREFILTGVTDEEWATFIPKEDEDFHEEDVGLDFREEKAF